MTKQITEKNILLVEPDQVQAGAIAAALSAAGNSIAAVTGAQAAIAAADAHKPDLVIVELALPSHNGVEFLHEFRSYEEWAHIPVIVFSQQHVADAAAFAALGAVYLYKPHTTLAVLTQKVAALLA